MIPHVKNLNGNIFLKTIIPSRKSTKKYLKKENYEKKNKNSSNKIR